MRNFGDLRTGPAYRLALVTVVVGGLVVSGLVFAATSQSPVGRVRSLAPTSLDLVLNSPDFTPTPRDPANCSRDGASIWQKPPSNESDTTWSLLNDFETLGKAGGGTLYLSPGRFVLENALDLPGYSNVSIQGAGEGKTILSLPPNPVGKFRGSNGSLLGLYNGTTGKTTDGSTINFIELGQNASQTGVNNFSMCDLSLDAESTGLNETWAGSLIYDQSGGMHHVYSDLAETDFFAPSSEPNGLHILDYISSSGNVSAERYVVENLRAVDSSYPYVAYDGISAGFNFLNIGGVSHATVDHVTGVGLWEFDGAPDPSSLFENISISGRMLIDPEIGGPWHDSLIENADINVNGTPSPDAMSTSVADHRGNFNSNMTGLRFYNTTFIGTVLGGRNMDNVEDSTFYGGLNSTPPLFENNRVVWINDNASRINLPIRVEGSVVGGSQSTTSNDTFYFPAGTAEYPGATSIEDPFSLESPVQHWRNDTFVIGGVARPFLFLAPELDLSSNSTFEKLTYVAADAGSPTEVSLFDLANSSGFADLGAAVDSLSNISNNLPPGAPAKLEAVDVGSASIRLHWKAPVGEVSGYVIQYGLSPDNLTAGEQVTSGSATSWVAKSLAHSTTYYFEVWAWTAQGQSPAPSNEASAET